MKWLRFAGKMDAQSFVEDLGKRLEETGVAFPYTITGCTLTEVSKIEEMWGHKLPEIYSAFLLNFGKAAGTYFRGSDLFYSRAHHFKEGLIDIIKYDPSGFKPPIDAIVISMHQGYEYLYIVASEGDDPPVYYYLEHAGKNEFRAERLSQFLIDAIYADW